MAELSNSLRRNRSRKTPLEPPAELNWKDRIRTRIVIAPFLTLFYCLFAKGLLLEGWRGIFYTLQRTYAELVLSLAILDRGLASSRNHFN